MYDCVRLHCVCRLRPWQEQLGLPPISVRLHLMSFRSADSTTVRVMQSLHIDCSRLSVHILYLWVLHHYTGLHWILWKISTFKNVCFLFLSASYLRVFSFWRLVAVACHLWSSKPQLPWVPLPMLTRLWAWRLNFLLMNCAVTQFLSCDLLHFSCHYFCAVL